MKGGSKLFLVAGVGLAIVAIGLLFMGMSGGGKKTDANQPETKPENVTVVQAAVAIPVHTMLKASDLIEVKMPSTDAPADAVKSTSEVLNFSYRVPLAQGQTLLKTQTEQPGSRNDIEIGKRAASIPVDEVSLLSGLVQDGDYVDLVRILPTTLAETPEDSVYKYSGGGNGLAAATTAATTTVPSRRLRAVPSCGSRPAWRTSPTPRPAIRAPSSTSAMPGTFSSRWPR